MRNRRRCFSKEEGVSRGRKSKEGRRGEDVRLVEEDHVGVRVPAIWVREGGIPAWLDSLHERIMISVMIQSQKITRDRKHSHRAQAP